MRPVDLALAASLAASQLAFLQGRSAMVVSGSWMLGEMADTNEANGDETSGESVSTDS